MRTGWIALVVVVMVAAGGVALADTGGRMGGGSWGDSSSSSSNNGGGWSSSSRSSSSSSRSSGWSYSGSHDRDDASRSYSRGDGQPLNLPPGLIAVFIGLGLVIAVGYVFYTQSSSSDSYYANDSYPVFQPAIGGVDVSVVRIAIDGRARKFVQTELAKIAKVADTATEDGRATMLREVTMMLRRVRDAWVYGGAVNEPMRGMTAAKGVFDAHVDEARAKFRHETIANVQGATTTSAAPDYIPRSEEGAGVILVTIVVAARTELFTVAHIGDGEDLRKALEAASHRQASDLVAIEIIWQPSVETDRLSSIELEAKYPHPNLIPIRGALVGKTFCSYCGGPFPAELVSCPHCGGPAAEAPVRAA